MPIVHFVNCKTQTAGGMRSVLGYVSQEKKTLYEDRKYVTGINCNPATAYEEMRLTKQLYGKTDGRQYYHLVQSFPKGYKISPKKAHRIAVEFAEKAFGQYECEVATHVDRGHIHSHIVFNSVSFVDGKKYHSDKDNPLKLMNLSDEICRKHNVHVLDDPKPKLKQKRVKVMSDREFRSRLKGQSWKEQLDFAITNCMKLAKSKKQFKYLMRERFGCDVRWEDNRKHITYTTPTGYKVRADRLHDEKYLKEAMENEFKIRGGELSETEITTGWEAERGYYQQHIEMQIGAEIVSGLADLATIIDSAPTDPEELERYLDSVRAVQNAGFVIGFVVEAVKLLSDYLEEMKVGMDEEQIEDSDDWEYDDSESFEETEDEGMMMM